MSTAKTILAINNDPDAPMVTKVHGTVAIGDLHEIVPAINEEVRGHAPCLGDPADWSPRLRRVDLLCVAAAVLVFRRWCSSTSCWSPRRAAAPRCGRWALLTLCRSSGAIYASRRTSWGRRSVAGLSGTVLIFLGYLTLFSVGVPLVLAAALCLVAALKSPPRPWQDTV